MAALSYNLFFSTFDLTIRNTLNKRVYKIMSSYSENEVIEMIKDSNISDKKCF